MKYFFSLTLTLFVMSSMACHEVIELLDRNSNGIVLEKLNVDANGKRITGYTQIGNPIFMKKSTTYQDRYDMVLTSRYTFDHNYKTPNTIEVITNYDRNEQATFAVIDRMRYSAEFKMTGTDKCSMVTYQKENPESPHKNHVLESVSVASKGDDIGSVILMQKHGFSNIYVRYTVIGIVK